MDHEEKIDHSFKTPSVDELMGVESAAEILLLAQAIERLLPALEPEAQLERRMDLFQAVDDGLVEIRERRRRLDRRVRLRKERERKAAALRNKVLAFRPQAVSGDYHLGGAA